jgi:hypothetical protein
MIVAALTLTIFWRSRELVTVQHEVRKTPG